MCAPLRMHVHMHPHEFAGLGVWGVGTTPAKLKVRTRTSSLQALMCNLVGFICMPRGALAALVMARPVIGLFGVFQCAHACVCQIGIQLAPTSQARARQIKSLCVHSATLTLADVSFSVNCVTGTARGNATPSAAARSKV